MIPMWSFCCLKEIYKTKGCELFDKANDWRTVGSRFMPFNGILLLFARGWLLLFGEQPGILSSSIVDGIDPRILIARGFQYLSVIGS